MEKRKIILDTSAYSEYLRGNHDIKQSMQLVDEIVMNPVVIAELLSGFKMGKQEEENKVILHEFLSSPRVQVINIDGETSERYAVILNALRARGTPIPTNDLWIAANAMQYGMKILTADKHYLNISQVITEYHRVR